MDSRHTLCLAASVPGLLLIGYLTDRWPLRSVITLSCLGSALSCLFLWGFATNTSVLIAFVIMFGLLGPSFSAMWATLIGVIASRSFDLAAERCATRAKFLYVVAEDDLALPPTIFPFFALMRGIGNITSGKHRLFAFVGTRYRMRDLDVHRSGLGSLTQIFSLEGRCGSVWVQELCKQT
jgi:MFS family permease